MLTGAPCPRFDGPRLGLPEDNVAGVGGEGRGSGAVPVGGHVDEQLHCEDRGEGRVQPVAAGERLSCKRAGNGAAGGGWREEAVQVSCRAPVEQNGVVGVRCDELGLRDVEGEISENANADAVLYSARLVETSQAELCIEQS